MAIHFFSEGIEFKLPHPRKTSNWIKEVIKKEKKTLVAINYIFCSDSYLLEINQGYLRHNSLTDIITFDNSQKNKLEAEIYISIDRVKENAKIFNSILDEELHRVIIHGVLHLVGYKDKTTVEKARMRKKEEACLSLRK
jgi:probable rRNA maturation factor